MRAGRFPAQEEAIQERLAIIQQSAKELAKKEVGTRRLFLGVAVGGVLGACAGGGAMHVLGSGNAEEAQDSKQKPALDPKFATFRTLATGPLDVLLAKAAPYLGEARQFPLEDRALWLGVVRIASAVAEHDPRAPRFIRPLLLSWKGHRFVPDHVLTWIELLETQGR